MTDCLSRETACDETTCHEPVLRLPLMRDSLIPVMTDNLSLQTACHERLLVMTDKSVMTDCLS